MFLGSVSAEKKNGCLSRNEKKPFGRALLGNIMKAVSRSKNWQYDKFLRHLKTSNI